MKKIVFFAVAATALLLSSCMKDNSVTQRGNSGGSLIASNGVAYNIFHDHATLQDEITVDQSGYAERGFVISGDDWATTTFVPAPMDGSSKITAVATGLKTNASYRAKAYLLDGSGNATYGKEFRFYTQKFIVYPAVIAALEGSQQLLPDSTSSKTLTVRAQVKDIGRPSFYVTSAAEVTGDKVFLDPFLYSGITIMEIGAYYWRVGDDESTALKKRLTVGNFPAVNNNGIIAVPLNDLQDDCQYYVKLYACSGINCVPAPRAVNAETYAPVYTVWTLPMENAGLDPVAVNAVTARTASFSCRLNFNGNDRSVKTGFIYGKKGSPDTQKVYVDRNASSVFNIELRNLDLGAEYTLTAFAETSSVKGRVLTTTVSQDFATLSQGTPIVASNESYNGYDWMTVNSSLNGNKNFDLKVASLVVSDEGLAIIASKSGIYYSTDRNVMTESITNGSLLESGGVTKVEGATYDAAKNIFVVLLYDIAGSTTYYFRSFATNDAGTAISQKIGSFRTPTYGGKQYRYSATANNKQNANPKLEQTGPDLIYYELDPLEMTSLPATVVNRYCHAMDRNLGASTVLPSCPRYSTLVPEALGYDYQAGRNTPSASPDMYLGAIGGTGTATATTVNGSSIINYGWTVGGSLFPPLNWPQDFTIWGDNGDPTYKYANTEPCPPGYRMPSIAESYGICALIDPAGKPAYASSGNVAWLNNTNLTVQNGFKLFKLIPGFNRNVNSLVDVPFNGMYWIREFQAANGNVNSTTSNGNVGRIMRIVGEFDNYNAVNAQASFALNPGLGLQVRCYRFTSDAID